jgi:hypothetical protein
MGFGQFRWGGFRSTHFEGVFRGFPALPVETPLHSGPKFRSAGRRPFKNFRKKGPAAPKFRPVDELASPEVCLQQKGVILTSDSCAALQLLNSQR